MEASRWAGGGREGAVGERLWCVWGGGEVDKFALATPHCKRNTTTMRIGGNFQKHVALISQVGTVRDALRYHAVGWSIVVNIGLGGRRSGRFGDTFRLGRCVPGGWVGHFALVKCYTLRSASGFRLLTFGQQLV